MADLDADGNIDYSNIPPFKVRGNSNATDIRRVIRREGETTVVTDLTPAEINYGANAKWQTVADMTGIQTCAEGVEIIVHDNNFQYMTIKPLIRIKDAGGATGSYSNADLAESFFGSRQGSKAASGVGMASGETTQRIYIPTTDLRRIQITNWPDPTLSTEQGFTVLAALSSTLEFRIS